MCRDAVVIDLELISCIVNALLIAQFLIIPCIVPFLKHWSSDQLQNGDRMGQNSMHPNQVFQKFVSMHSIINHTAPVSSCDDVVKGTCIFTFIRFFRFRGSFRSSEWV
mmetsp:Transcript_26814/g.51991  ORF Transcript_26814/g.51991 Transcript_26814/m.51991 type:complete len:108 (-) Transcript_26814:84-407(-)